MWGYNLGSLSSFQNVYKNLEWYSKFLWQLLFTNGSAQTAVNSPTPVKVIEKYERWISSVWNCNFKCFDLKACMEISARETSNVVKILYL